MVFVMTPTPQAILLCGYDDLAASSVIKWHVVAMFAPGFFTGQIIAKFGARSVVIMGMGALFLASVTALLGLDLAVFHAALILSGLGWNFAFIGGTSLLLSSVSEEDKSAVQGLNETLVAAVSTIAAFASGTVMSEFGWLVVPATTLPVLAIVLAVMSFRLKPATA